MTEHSSSGLSRSLRSVMTMPQSWRRVGGMLLLTPLLLACSPAEQSLTDPGTSVSDGADMTPAAEASPGYTRLYAANPADPLDAHIFELDNGLQVYLTENREEPRFYAEIAVRAGSKHDPADATGLAHYLEHLLFKGNQSLGTLDFEAERPYLEQIQALYEEHFNETDNTRRAEIYAEINRVSQLASQYAIPGELDKIYNSMGATGLNAHTSNEETVYKVGLPSNRLEQWAEIESTRFVNPVFRLFHTELEIVYEEKNRTLDNRDRLSYYAMMELMYKNHPYGQQSTIGDAEHLKNPSLVYIQNYFDTYYVPNNMAIFVSGDIDINETIALISEKFSIWQAKPLPVALTWTEAPVTAIERVSVSYPGEEQVQMAFHTVPNGHEDQEALMLLDMILDNRTAGLINLNLSQRQRVQAAGSSPQFQNDFGAQTLWGVPREGQTLLEVEQLLLEQIDLIRRGEFEDWILPAIVNDFKSMEKRGLESNTARVGMMQQSFLQFADWDYTVAQILRLEQVSKADIVEVANKYFTNNNYVAVHRLNGPADIPTVDKPAIDPVTIDPSRQSAFASVILAMPYAEIQPVYLQEGEDYQILQYAADVPLYYAPNPLNDIFTFSMSIEVGTEENDLLSLGGAVMGKAGTVDLPLEELQKQWYRLGSQFSFSSGANETVISISGMDPQFEESLALMLALARNPQTDAATFEELKNSIQQARGDQREDPAAISQALYLFNRYGDESPMLRALSSDAIRAVELEQVLSLISSLQNYKHTLSYTGSLTPDELTAILQRQHPVAGDLLDTPPYRFRHARQVSSNDIFVIHRETAQAQVRLEFTDGEYDESLVVPSSLYNNYFGNSMSSVVFQELREARALAYSAAAQYSQGGRLGAENLALGAIGSQNDKAVEATAAFIELFNNMPASADRFADAYGSLVNRYRSGTVGFRAIPGTVRGWKLLGLDGDPRPQRFAQLQNASLEDLMQFQRERIAGKPKLISIVGDTSRMDMSALSAMGAVRELNVDDVFVE